MVNYDYFDKDYYQAGYKKGTVYNNYIEESRKSHTYREIANNIYEVFQPKKVLEIGCATGIIVKYLNELGIEAHGIDVSKFATENAEHENVVLASCDKMPYKDKEFDLVFSCHALEHIPDDVFLPSIAELDRVCSGYQFHMLPTMPDGLNETDNKAVFKNFKIDPTHFQLHTLAEWINIFRDYGWSPVNTFISFENDNLLSELTLSQFIINHHNNVNEQQIIERSIKLNKNKFRGRFDTVKKSLLEIGQIYHNSHAHRLEYNEKTWKDIIIAPLMHAITSESVFKLYALLDGDDCVMRLSLLDDKDSIAEYIFSLKSGANFLIFSFNNFRHLRGNLDANRINRLFIGGEAEKSVFDFYVDIDDKALKSTQKRESITEPELYLSHSITMSQYNMLLHAFKNSRWIKLGKRLGFMKSIK